MESIPPFDIGQFTRDFMMIHQTINAIDLGIPDYPIDHEKSEIDSSKMRESGPNGCPSLW